LHLLRLLNKLQKQNPDPEVQLEIGQVKVLDSACPELQRARHRAREELSHDQNVSLITRLAKQTSKPYRAPRIQLSWMARTKQTSKPYRAQRYGMSFY